MDLPKQNAKYIQLLNNNNIRLEQNIAILERSLKTMDDAISAVARDSAAMQRAVVEFLKEKGILENEEDLKLLQKLHMRHIAQLDQEITARKAQKKEESS